MNGSNAMSTRTMTNAHPLFPAPRARLRLGSFLSPLLVAAASVACGGSPPPAPVAPAVSSAPPPPPPSAAAPDESFRKTPPPLGADAPFTPPNVQEKRLKNGVRILVAERHELPVVAIDLAFDRGADQDKPGLGGFEGAMLLRGSKTRSALQLSDDLDRLGASAGASVDYDAVWLTLNCLQGKFPAALALAADIVENPAFAKDEIERERSQRLTAIAQQNDRPSTLLGNTVSEVLYPAGHPYSSSLLGVAETVKRVQAADLVRFHDEVFHPDRLTVSVAGDVRFDDVVAQVDHAFGAWKGSAPKEKSVVAPPPPKADDPRVVLVDRPGATQSHVSFARVGVPRRTPDYDALLVMNSLLGGAFSSRLNMNLREAHAFTYGASSGFDFRHGPGPFTAGAAVVREKTGPAVTEILKEVDRMRTEPVSDAELADAKAYLVRALPARFETVESTARSLAALAVYGLPLDEYATRPARIAKITVDDVKRAAATYLASDAFRLIVVGDAKVVQPQLAEVGLGPVSVRAAAPAAAAAKKGEKTDKGDMTDTAPKQGAEPPKAK
jgi:zinc protease